MNEETDYDPQNKEVLDSYLETPPDEITIWRYLDFTQFISILERKSLFFSRADKFSDPFEGSIPQPNKKVRELFAKDKKESQKKLLLKKLPKLYKKQKKLTYLNCWHIKAHETAAMWDLYSNDGITIKTNIRNLKESLRSYNENKLYLYEVKYIDFEKEPILREANSILPFFHKRKSYEHERELRILIQPISVFTSPSQKGKDGGSDFDGYVPINIDKLIEKIYVSPTAPDWLYDLIQNVNETYDLNKEIKKSYLDKDPIY